MKIILFDKNVKKGQFVNYGYGKLRKILKCEVVEEINGRYDTELIINMSESKQKLIKKWSIIYIDGQLFRIMNRTDIDKENIIKIFMKHIFYDINNGFIIDNRAENKTVAEALKIAIPDDFKVIFETESDIKSINSLYFVKNNGAENIFGIIDRWGEGELVRDNFKIAINKEKGKDKGVTFTYQKIEAIEVDENVENVVTRLYPTGKEGITLEEKYIVIPGWNDEDYPPFHITKEVKFEGAESIGELRVLARKEAERIGLSRINFKINVHDLRNTSLAKHIPELYDVEVGDIVTIKHHKLDVRVKVKCIKKTHEKVTNKLVLEFGQPLENFFDAVDNGNNQVTIPDTSKYEDHMFFYFNDKEININNDEESLCYLNYGVTSTTNLMLYFNLFFECDKNCEIQLTFKVDNTELVFKPVVSIEKGKRLLAFTYPMIGIEGGKAHLLNIKITITENAKLKIQKENLQIVVKGQNVNGAMKEAPHAEIDEIFNCSNIIIKNLDSKNSVSIKNQLPENIILKEKLNLQQFNNKNINLSDNIDILITSLSYLRPIDSFNYIYDKEKIEVNNNIMTVKTVENIASSIVIGELENGILQELSLVDRTLWNSIQESEFINE